MSSESPKQALFAAVRQPWRRRWRIHIDSDFWSSLPKASGALRCSLTAPGYRSPTRPSICNTCAAPGSSLRRREGKFVFYHLADDAVLDLLASLRRIAERNSAEVERVVRSYFQNRDSLEPVSRLELMERLKAGLVTVLDLRPEDEFALGHLPGAVNIQLGELEKRLADLDPDQEIVAYCRGPYCVLSYEAVAVLRARGFKVRRLEDGLPEWRAAGLPVHTGAGP